MNHFLLLFGFKQFNTSEDIIKIFDTENLHGSQVFLKNYKFPNFYHNWQENSNFDLFSGEVCNGQLRMDTESSVVMVLGEGTAN